MLPNSANIWQIAASFRRAELRNERAAASEMVRSYGKVWTEIDRQIRDLTQRYYLADEPKASWLYQLDRLQTLRQQVEAQLRQFSGYADQAIRAQQWQAIQAGRDHAGALMQAAAAGQIFAFNVLPSDALAYMVGFQQDGSPLLDVLNRYGEQAAQAMSDRLLQGLALGQGPGTVARLVRKDMGMALWEALRLARTETLRAYRAANLETYRANEDIIEGWYWLSARNTRTCAMCWAMDGTFHKLSDSLDDHPNGRCTAVPKIKGVDLPERLTGVEAFEKLRDVDQFRILGPSKYAAYRAGDLKLPQLIGVKHSQEWGRMFYERSLKKVWGNTTANAWKFRAREEGLWGLSPSLGAARNRLAELQLQRFAQLDGTKTREVITRMRSWNLPLPELEEHFRIHAKEFLSTGIVNADQYQKAFAAHSQKANLRYFTYLQRKKLDRMWISIDPETGNVGQFNETKNTYWSFFHHDEIDKYLSSGKMWWIEVQQDNDDFRFSKWT